MCDTRAREQNQSQVREVNNITPMRAASSFFPERLENLGVERARESSCSPSPNFDKTSAPHNPDQP
jgi:hypothetical protein